MFGRHVHIRMTASGEMPRRAFDYEISVGPYHGRSFESWTQAFRILKQQLPKGWKP